MTTLSASDIAALRIREARKKRGWTVKDLAGQCAKAGVPHITAAVITNLETRRRPGREITAEELVALAWVLDVPPVQLLSPIGGAETLGIVPGEEKGPLEAAAWLADEDAVLTAVRPAASGQAEDTERTLRYRGSPLTVIRQVRAAIESLRFHDLALSSGKLLKASGETADYHKNSVTILGLRLLHLSASLEALGYSPTAPEDVTELLARHGIPPTLAGWEQIVSRAKEGKADGESP